MISKHSFPTVVVDAQWNLIAANPAASIFTNTSPSNCSDRQPTSSASACTPTASPHVVNFNDYATHIISRLRRTIDQHHDATLQALLDEFGHLATPHATQHPGVLLPLELRTPRD